MNLENRLIRLLLISGFIAAFLSCSHADRSGQHVQKEEKVLPEMVLIPGGEFRMGSDTEGNDNPEHKVYVDSFYMDRYEVTNARYAAFCKETGRELPEFWGVEEFHCGPAFPDHPVVGVTWTDAGAYAEWCGKRLPTEAEWEHAARGGLPGSKYPYGDTIEPSRANYHPSEGTVPVGSYRPNGYGLYDMAGNVVEWVADYYDEDYYKTSPHKNPEGPEQGTFRVIRGGGWHSGPFCNTVHFRNGLPGRWVDFNVGFRCVRDVPSEPGFLE